MVVNAWGSS